MRAMRAAVASAMLASAVFLLPSYLYQSSQQSIDLPLANFLLIGGGAAIALATSTLLILAVTRFSAWAIAGVAGIALALTAKIHVWPSSVPILDGEQAFAPATSAEGISSIVSLVLFPLGIYAARKLSTGALAIGFAAILAFTLAPAVSGEQKPYDQAAFAAPDNSFFTMSREGGVLVILLDALPSDVFAEIAASDERILRGMDGFTYFPNTTSSAPTTLMNMIAVYSGRQYTHGSIRDHYVAAAQDGVFSDAERAGYQTELAGFTPYLCPADACYPIDQVTGANLRESSRAAFVNLVQLGHLRTVPTVLQDWLYNGGAGRITLDAAPSGHVEQSIATLRTAAAAFRAEDLERSSFRFLHVFVTHPPVTANANCNRVDRRELARGAYKAQAICGLNLLVDFLDAMRAANAYDNTAIVLLSDHGSTVPSESDEDPRLLDGVALLSGRAQRFNPTFAVKPRNATNPLEISTAPTSNADLRAALCEIAYHCAADYQDANPFPTTDRDRQRRFIDFRYTMRQLIENDSLPTEGVTQFVIGGDVRAIDGQLWSPAH